LAAAPRRASPLNFESAQTQGTWEGVRYDAKRGAILLTGEAGAYSNEGVFTSAPLSLSEAKKWQLSWRPRWTTPLEWTRSAENPVLTSTPGTWDEGTVSTCSIVESASGLTMFYGARDHGIGVADGSAADLAHWRKRPAPVLRAGKTGAFDAGGVLSPAVVQVSSSLWYMYYVGYDPTRFNGQVKMHQIGLARSVDAGRSWARVSTEPVLALGPPGSCDGATISSNTVLKLGDRWYCWYTGISQFPYLASVCLATSSDGIRWTKYPHNPVLSYNPYVSTDAFMVATPQVLYEEGVFKMWYNSKGFGEGTRAGDYHIGYAESLDGILWERSPTLPVLGPSGHGWDSQMAEYPEVLALGAQYYLFYCGNGYGSIGYAEGRSATRAVVATRRGKSAAPDASWSDWVPCSLSDARLLADAGPYAQVRISLSTTNRNVTPMIQHLALEPHR
jgi:predicted GH43/DUF377 family glycosyl hydrolase